MKINIGVLGCANIAYRYILPELVYSDRVNKIYLASRSFNKAKEWAKHFQCIVPVDGYENLLNEQVDLVYIPLPNKLHAEWIEKCLLAGLHVWVEKPMTTEYHETIRLNALAKKKQLILIENFQFRFHSQQQFVKTYLNENKLGKIRCFRSSFGFPPFSDRYNIRYNKALGGGVLFDAGTYPLKITNFLFGAGFEVSASQLHYDSDFDVDIYGSACLTNQDGLVAQIAFGFDNSYQCNYEIWGSKAKITLMRAFTAAPGYNPIAFFEDSNERKEIVLEGDNHFKNILDYIIDMINNPLAFNEYDENIEQSRLINEVLKNAKIY
jgi:dTDP-3,4-didehydro-2,6-dideoxy-alpha-D-glucose 3-reductase